MTTTCEQPTKEKQLLEMHCAHDKPVYARCETCEEDAKAGRTRGFTKRDAIEGEIEHAYWVFDNAKKGYMPKTERDAFKFAVRTMLGRIRELS